MREIRVATRYRGLTETSKCVNIIADWKICCGDRARSLAKSPVCTNTYFGSEGVWDGISAGVFSISTLPNEMYIV